MSVTLKVISPVDGSVYAERPLATADQIASVLLNSAQAQSRWRLTTLEERRDICLAAVSALLDKKDVLAQELSWQMGRPRRYGAGEINGFAFRARSMIDIARGKLQDIRIAASAGFEGFNRYIQRHPLGVVFVIVPWNYPYLTAVNSIIPAIMAGNSVVMKPSSLTPLTGERIVDAFTAAGLPKGVLQLLLLNHADTQRVIGSGEIQHVCFTGSVSGGEMVEQAAAGRFIGVGLELGGKDPAYVRADADLEFTLDNLVDGAFYNSGQSCCGIERIYVQEPVYEVFIAGFVSRTLQYQLGNPLLETVTLGPMVSARAADRVRRHIDEALERGATALIDQAAFAGHQTQGPYLAPQVLTGVDHSMAVMREESFGPVVGIMRVADDQSAVQLMNDSPYGLTASVWTADEGAAQSIGDQLNTGTVFMNRCDYLDPQLAWTGVKHSGKGCTLSEIGYETLTRPKSYHLRLRLQG